VCNFLEQLLNINNPDFARIGGFTYKDQNTPTTLALGINRMLLNVMTLTSMDSIVFQTTVGESVVVEEQLPQAA
jgi:ribosomal protein L5